jgi:hypothetical protein
MIETYEDIKELIDDGLDNFRRNHLSLVSAGPGVSASNSWWAVQISVSGTDVWRRALVPETFTLDELHRLVQAALDWSNAALYRFSFTDSTQSITKLRYNIQIGEMCDMGITELLYEYGTVWTVKLIFHSPYEAGKDEVIRFVTGAGAAPPENIAGPLRFRRIMTVLDTGTDAERQEALRELGSGFVPGLFDIDKCNHNLVSIQLVEK